MLFAPRPVFIKKKTVELQCTLYVVRVFRIVTTKDKTEKFK